MNMRLRASPLLAPVWYHSYTACHSYSASQPSRERYITRPSHRQFCLHYTTAKQNKQSDLLLSSSISFLVGIFFRKNNTKPTTTTMYASTITALLAAALMAGASAAPAPKDTRQISNRRAVSVRRTRTVIGEVNSGTGEQPLTVFNNPDSIGFGFVPQTIQITLSGASCSLFTGRIGNDANGNIACDLNTHVADIFFGDAPKDVSDLGIECAFCSF
jgi:hypothetical protein